MKILSVLALLLLLCSSCVTGNMPLREGMKSIDLEKGSIALFSIKTSKTFKQKYRAVATRVRVSGVDFSKDYMIPEGQGDWTGGDLEFFCSAQLKPGIYKIKSIRGMGGDLDGPWYGTFDCLVWAHFEVLPNEVVYVGRVVARCRARRDGEPRAGSRFPLVNQGISGFAAGTWDLEAIDNSAFDLKDFTDRYPVLSEFKIAKRIMTLQGKEAVVPR